MMRALDIRDLTLKNKINLFKNEDLKYKTHLDFLNSSEFVAPSILSTS